MDILLAILEHGEKILRGKKTIGHGLLEADFDKNNVPGTREIMRSRSEPFLESKYIKMLRAKGKKSKGYYSITSLGLVFLFQNKIEITETIFKKTITNLQFFIRHNQKNSTRLEYDPILDFKLIEKQLKEIDKKLLFQILRNVFNQIEIKKDADKIKINLNYMVDEEIFSITKRFVIKNKKIYEKETEITEEEFGHYVALFVLLSFHHALVVHFIREEDKKMFESFNIDLLKEISDFNSSRLSDMSHRFTDYINVQRNIDERLKII
ncbi:hypothetical protein [Nitrosopumilus sp.]|uniref:hypothetical protein n=1 Tax=Nitrosopumilus sp. TaxID=2024843 RepID=UPI00247D08E8|nr:hypothetical protein [Nitrosopumilus sp.]MCV0409387.1 hypothetical protein [Nitrosopumilus sp.]